MLADDLAYNPETGLFWWKKPLPRGGNRPMDRPAGSYRAGGYREIYYDGERYVAHRLAWFLFYGEWPEGQIDHINGVRDDNRIGNLRVATNSQNKANSRKPRTNTTGYKGVQPRGERWIAQIKHGGKRRFLGTFPTPEEAHQAYCRAAAETFGTFFHPG